MKLKSIGFLMLAVGLNLFYQCKPSRSEVGQSKTEKDWISGKVIEINKGKDGYTAKIEANNGETYFATISHANLKDPSQYKSVAVGETISVKGGQWNMENEKHITVREIK